MVAAGSAGTSWSRAYIRPEALHNATRRAVVVLDIGNLYVHQKHAQTLVDAGAFAGATKFVGCSFQFGDPVAANDAIKTTVLVE